MPSSECRHPTLKHWGNAKAKWWTCTACGTPAHEGACDASALASVRAIARECRPCVQCGAPSLRAEGCSVMWCVHCHAFWHWDTGRAIQSRAAPHNPDHRAWVGAQRTVARELDDLPCGGLPERAALHMALVGEFARTRHVPASAPVILAAEHMLSDAQRMRHAYPQQWDARMANEPLRISYLLGDLDDVGLGRALERQERTHHWRRAVGAILEALVLASVDVLQRFVASHITAGRTAIELAALREQADDALLCTCRCHARAVPRVSAAWQWTLPNRRHA